MAAKEKGMREEEKEGGKGREGDWEKRMKSRMTWILGLKVWVHDALI